MLKRFLKRLVPSHQVIRDHKHLQVFGTLLHHPNLWHLNRRGVAGAFSLGLFAAFVPIPSQMALAAAGAILLRVNLPIAVALVWLTNPITIPPLYYSAYKLGAWLLGRPPRAVQVELSLSWLRGELAYIWEPLLLGCFVLGSISAVLGYVLIHLLWRWQVLHSWRQRKQRRRHAPG
jgi:uncharacterized protein